MKITSVLDLAQIKSAKKLLTRTFGHIGLKASDLDASFTSPEIYLVKAMVEKGKVIGIALAQKKVGYFGWLAVAPAQRKKGIASRLCKAIESELKKNKRNHVSLDTRNQFKDALVFYLKNGYKITGSFIHTDGEIMIRMSKKL